MIRVLIADDQELVLEGLALILSAESDLEVVGLAGDGLQAVELTRRLRPDIVLLDVRMPELDGLAAARRILAGDSPPRVVMLTTYDSDEYALDALLAGASGFLLKDAPRAALVHALHTALAGEVTLAHGVTQRLIQRQRSDPPAPLPPDLTDRELEVLRAIGKGHTNAEIAADLYVSVPTVKTHVSRLLVKLGQRDRIQLALIAARHATESNP
jgi:DNA-binding NarL/FixJ family response regulator